MSEKLKTIKVNVFVKDDYVFPNQSDPLFRNGRYYEILLPVDAIAYLTESERGMPARGYEAHIKGSYVSSLPFPVKSINSVRLKSEQVEVIAGSTN